MGLASLLLMIAFGEFEMTVSRVKIGAALGALVLALVIEMIWAPAASAKVAVDAKAEVATALYQSALTAETFVRQANSQLSAKQRQIDKLSRQVRAENGRNAALKAELAAAQEDFVAELSAKDRAYATTIAVFRKTLGDIASSPERIEALAKFNAGDLVGAAAIFDQLDDAQASATQMRADIEKAAPYRVTAELFLDARNKGKWTTQDVLARYEKVVSIDPGVSQDWVKLSRLYRDAGDLPNALTAAVRAGKTATNNGERAAALEELGKVSEDQGDLLGARKAYDESLAMSRDNGANDPANGKLTRDILIGLANVGDVAMDQGDLAGARRAFDESLDIARALSVKDATSIAPAFDITKILRRLGDILLAQGDLPSARTAYDESLAAARQLSAKEPTNTFILWNVAVSISKVGDITMVQGDLPGARRAYEESVAILRDLSAKDPSNTRLARDLSVGVATVGDVAMALGDLPGARRYYDESLIMSRGLSAADPFNAGLARNVSVSLGRMGEVAMAEGDFAVARRAIEESLNIDRGLSAKDPSNTGLARDVSVTLIKVGDVARGQGDLSGARTAYEDSLAMLRDLSGKDASNANLTRDIAVSLGRVGDIANAQGDLESARRAYGESLDIFRGLNSKDPSNGSTDRDIAASLWSLAAVPASGTRWRDVVAHLEAMKDRGTLAPADQQSLDEAIALAAVEKSE